MRRWNIVVALAAVLAATPALAQSGAPANPPVSWAYGEHPQWGLSAHITDGAHSVGLRCVPAPKGGDVVAVEVSPGLVAPGGEDRLHYRFEGGNKGFGSYGMERKAGYLEAVDSVCAINFVEFQKARAFVLENGAEKPKILGRIPLTGAKAAIGKLIAACPAIRSELENCGL